MVNKEQILRRLKEYKKFKSDAEFARFIGVGPTVLATWYKRNTFNIDKIANVFPEINYDFLLTGNGSMLKNEVLLPSQTTSEEIDLYKKLIASLDDTVSSQKIIIQKLQTEIIRLQRAALYKPGLGRRRAASATPPDAEPI